MFGKLHHQCLYVLSSVLFGLKTYIIYRFLFNINLENFLQEFILFINPFISAFFIFSLSVWMKESRQRKFIRYVALVGTLILYFNLIFYRNFGDFLTIPILFQGSNAADLGSSIMALLKPFDILLFLDAILIWYLCKQSSLPTTVSYSLKAKRKVLGLSILLLLFNYGLAELERPQLLQRGFDREYLVKNIGLFNFHLYDLYQQTQSQAQRVFADGNELYAILDYMKEETTDHEETEMFGIAEGKNVIFITLESLQTFVINNTLHGEEITPFLNEFINESYYFENFYHQTEQGKTADSEFIMENSLYGLPSGSVYFTHAQNEYYSSPQILNKHGYKTAVLHANNKSFWNRDVMYDNLGIDLFHDIKSYDVTDENSVGWGLKDVDFFDQSIKYLHDLPEPYYARFITLTNHHPFDLDEEDATIEPFDSNSRTLNQYFQTVRYMDEAVEKFINQLKDEGIYDDSIIVMMGDHYGISDFHNNAMSEYLDKEEITPYDHVQLQRVPFYIHIPGHDGEIISDIAGQVDVKPTLLHLLGINDPNELSFGTNLFGPNRKAFIALRDGSFITEENVYSKGSCYDRNTGEVLDTGLNNRLNTESEDSVCAPIRDEVEKELSYSDAIIYGDLFRYHDFD